MSNSRTLSAYGREDVEFLEQVVRQLAAAINNMRRNQDARTLQGNYNMSPIFCVHSSI
jgi:GAF domain-containing protein